MRRETAFAATAALIVVLSAVVVAAAPGAVSPPDADDTRPERPGRLAIEEMTISPTEVSGGTVSLSVRTHLVHAGPPTENVTVLFRAVDTDTDFVAAEKRVRMATVDGDREVTANGTLSVDREGDYRIESVVYRNGSRLTTGTRTVYEVGSLTPAYARTPIEFHDFDRRVGALPTVTYSIAGVEDGEATLNASAYLTNTGDAPAGDLELVFVARQVDSNVVADRARVSVDRLRPGRTATPRARLTVPDEYNYYLVALLQKDGVIVDVSQSSARLNPNVSVADNDSESDDEDGFRAGDFEEETETTVELEETTEAAYEREDSGGQPGFALPAALLALLAALALRAARERGGD